MLRLHSKSIAVRKRGSVAEVHPVSFPSTICPPDHTHSTLRRISNPSRTLRIKGGLDWYPHFRTCFLASIKALLWGTSTFTQRASRPVNGERRSVNETRPRIGQGRSSARGTVALVLVLTGKAQERALSCKGACFARSRRANAFTQVLTSMAWLICMHACCGALVRRCLGNNLMITKHWS